MKRRVMYTKSKPDIEINFELTKRIAPDLKCNNIHELFDDIIKPSGMTFKGLQVYVTALKVLHLIKRDSLLLV